MQPRPSAPSLGARGAVPHFPSPPETPSSPPHQREHTPAQVLTRVSGVALGFGGQLGSNLFRHLVIGIGFKPSAHGEPFGRLISVPTVLVSQNHFNDVIAKVAEQREKFWKHEK